VCVCVCVVQDYELQLMTYRAFVETTHKSPVKRRRMHSSSDAITQEVRGGTGPLECQNVRFFSDDIISSSCACSRFSVQFMDLRTRYTALVTLTTQHVKYISDALRRLEEEEVGRGFLFVACGRIKSRMHRDCVALSVQKEVEEEKQARVGHVSDLLGWVQGLQGRTGGPNAESSLAAQQVTRSHTLCY